MDTSDTQRPPAAAPAGGTSEAPKDAAQGDAAQRDDDEHLEQHLLLPDEAETIERAHFEMLERETTQPARPRPYAVPAAEPAPPEPAPRTQPTPTPPASHVAPSPARAFEPAPFDVLPPTDRPLPVVPQRAPAPPPVAPAPAEPQWVGPAPAPDAQAPFSPEPFAPSAHGPAASELVVPEPVALPAPEPPEIPAAMATFDAPNIEHRNDAALDLPTPAPAVHAYEAPERGPPADVAADWRELLPTPQPAELEPPLLPEPSEPETAPREPYAAPPLSIDHPRWEPGPELRVDPRFDFAVLPSPAAHADAAPAALAMPPRNWRDLVRRAAAVAFLVFAGWFAAVLLLIVVYRFIDPPFSMLMAQRFLTGTSIDKQWVPITRISPNLSRAVIVAEDGRFCSHWGVDFVEAANAIRRSSSGYPRGASTITMQVAKNLFLVPAKSYLRKMVEIPLTFAIELVWPKKRILEIYLNIVEWGPGVFGAEAASRAHFGRAAASLTARQAAQLAAVLPNPIIRDAGSPGPRTAHKASIIQARAARTREASACVDTRR